MYVICKLVSCHVRILKHLKKIQVQAVQADEDSSKSKAPAFEDQDDDNEENNLIPFSDVPHGDQVRMDQ